MARRQDCSDAANGVAGEAEKKAANAEAELGAKQKPYDEDPLFIYLWQRGFGTGRYQAGNLVRFMDRMVADFIDFGSVRPNYAALIEIPLRLREHATAKRAAAAERLAALSGIERRAMVEAGVEPKERTLAEARHRLAAADTTLDEKHDLLRKLDTERNALLSAGSNPAYEEALSVIASADAKDQVATLYLEAGAPPLPPTTPSSRSWRAWRQQIAKADAEVADLRRTAKDLAKRRIEVERVRDRFRGAGYDHPHGTFGNDNAIADALGRIAGRQHRRPGSVGDPAGRLQHARPRRTAGFRLSHLTVPLPHPRRRQHRPLGRRVARPLKPRQLDRRWPRQRQRRLQDRRVVLRVVGSPRHDVRFFSQALEVTGPTPHVPYATQRAVPAPRRVPPRPRAPARERAQGPAAPKARCSAWHTPAGGDCTRTLRPRSSPSRWPATPPPAGRAPAPWWRGA